MKAILLDGEAKEVADLVLALQGQRNLSVSPETLVRSIVHSAIDDTEQGEPSSS